MNLEPAHRSAPLRPLDPQSSPSLQRRQSHKRQRSKTIGETFVSTAVVPAPSSTDVLSSLISSLTLISGSAREQRLQQTRARDIKESQNPYIDPTPAASSLDLPSPLDIQNELHSSRDYPIHEASDGDEAEAPVIGYARSRSKDSKRSTTKEKWAGHTQAKDKLVNIGRSGSANNLRRPPSGASSHIGIPSIERGRGASSISLPMSSNNDSRSASRMLPPPPLRHDDESINLSQDSLRDFRDSEAKSMKSFRTTKSKQSVHTTHEQDDTRFEPVPSKNDYSPTRLAGKSTPEFKTYSPLSPVNREDLGEHLIPSRRSSVRHSPSLRGSSKGRSPSVRSKSQSRATTGLEITAPGLCDEAVEEEDLTLRRIRELQQAKEKRHTEWRKESSRSERASRRPPRNRSKSGEDVAVSKQSIVLDVSEKPEVVAPSPSKEVEQFEVESISVSAIRDIDMASPSPTTIQAMPSPALSTPRKHKRSLSAGLRRSTSSKQRPVEDLRSVSEQVEAFLTAPRLTQRIRHPRTGRTIAFSEVGDPDGFPVICCVGMGLTRYVTTFYDDVARASRLRLITPDRPGIGETSPFTQNVCTPLAWVDDVAVICQALNLDRFSLLAHSAGSIFALATALKMPDMVRGRIHLLAPWIPPSQFPNGSASGEMKSANLPMAHRLLSVLPAPFLRAANSRFLSATSASIEPRANRSRKKEQSISSTYDDLLAEMSADMQPSRMATVSDLNLTRHSSLSQYTSTPTPPPYSYRNGMVSPPASPSPTTMRRQYSTSTQKFRSPTPNDSSMSLTPQARQALFNSELTHRTWSLATLNANPAVDLLVCLERRRPVGFKYVDVTRGVVIHHGRNDARVPLDNVQWLSGAMKRCELRILSDEGHGLMASANVMSKVLAEIGREWEEWDVIARDNEKKKREMEQEQERIKEQERKRFARGIY